MNQLQDLVFKLGFDYEDMPGQTKQDFARELVLHSQRRGQVEELLRLVRRERPAFGWD